MVVVAAALLGTGWLQAQGGTGAVVHTAPTPLVTIAGLSVASSLSSWPGIARSVDSDAYVTVFAVTRTKGSALPIQLLAPARPGDARRIKARATVSQRPHRRCLSAIRIAGPLGTWRSVHAQG